MTSCCSPAPTSGLPLFVFDYTTDLKTSKFIVDFVIASGGENITDVGIRGLAARLPTGRFNLVFIAHGTDRGLAGG